MLKLVAFCILYSEKKKTILIIRIENRHQNSSISCTFIQAVKADQANMRNNSFIWSTDGIVL